MTRRKWYLVAIIGALIAIFVFAVIIYTLKTPTDFDYPPNTADLIFDFLAKWALAGAPAIMLIGIAVALIIGIMSLHQTRDIQQGERKQRLVKEIEKWARDVIGFIDEYEIGRGTSETWYRMKARWNILKATKANMKETAHKIDRDFGQKVENAITAFDTLDKNIDKGIISNVYNDLERCKKSCQDILESVGLLKFKEIR